MRLTAATLLWCALLPLSAQADAVVPTAERLAMLQTSYPDVIKSRANNQLTLSDGTKLIIDDGKDKSHQQKLKNADIEDMLSQIYPTLACMGIDEKPDKNFDPGRIRNDAFMKAAFGSSPAEVRKDLESVAWFGKQLLVTRRFGVSDAMRRVEADLRKLKNLDRSFVQAMGGTFKWRKIAGTDRMSVHSFAAAVDVNTEKTDYWRWSGGKPGNVPKYRNRIPENIVAAFERHGFIWGGRWYHYDTMHFEYRPAVMAIARLAEKRGCAK